MGTPLSAHPLGGAPGLLLALGSTACVVEQPCGWDRQLELDSSYSVTLQERYTSDATTARYAADLDLTHPAPSCGALDEFDVGTEASISLVQGPGTLDCSFWKADMSVPPIDTRSRIPLVLNNRSSNLIVVSAPRDLGDGCSGSWEFSIHSPFEDPFAPQRVNTAPVVVAYRVFIAAAESHTACAERAGLEPGEGEFRCGDAFVASMARTDP